MTLDQEWTKVGGIAGILTAILYISLALAFLPQVLSRLAFFSLGLLTIITMIGLYHVLKAHRMCVPLQLGTVFTIVGGAIMNVMAVVQNSIYASMQKYFTETSDDVARDSIRRVWRGLNSVHLGLDVSCDIFILSGIVLTSTAMLSHPRFGRMFGATGIVLAAVTLAVNLYAFPNPPGSASGTGVDLGPLIGLWTLIVSVQMLRSLSWIEQIRPESISGIQ